MSDKEGRNYELVLLLPPDLEKKDQLSLFQLIEEEIKKEKGKVVEKKDWGRKRLSYKINHHEEGDYFLWQVVFPQPPQLSKINLFFKREERLLRYLWTRTKLAVKGKKS